MRAACPAAARSSSSWRRRAAASSRQAPLLELAGHRDQALHEPCEVLACDSAPPRVGARAPVGEDAPRSDESLLSLRAKLGDRRELLVLEDPVGEVELGFDVCLLRPRPEVPGIPGSPEEKADRLREDRLPGPRLAGDGVDTGAELELRLADEHEVLDP